MIMKEIASVISNWRYWALVAIALISAVCILSDTTDEATAIHFVLVKAIGFTAAYAFVRLFAYWAKHRKIDSLLRIVFND